MDEDVLLREIMKSLAFEIEAVNQDNVLKWTCTNGTPLSVKVRVRNKDEPRLVQRGAIPMPRIGITAPEQLTLVSSDQTILSFRVFMENELIKKEGEKRHGGFKIFNIGSCLGTYSDDEGPYLPSSSNQKALENDNDDKSSSGNLKNKTSAVVSTSKAAPRVQKRLFGKCKPGGCLDPPFGEDNYPYGLPITDRQEKLRHEINALEDNKKSCKPGGCLDPPCGEEKFPYIHSKQDKQDHEIKLHEIKDSTEHETISQKITKDEVDQKKITNIYARVSEENMLAYSDSIITYPTETPSNETLHNQAQSKKISVKSINNESLRQSYEYPESYFIPPKDVVRYKEEERRNVRKLSTEHLGRGSKVSSQDTMNKSKVESKSDEFKNTTQKTRKLKDLPKETIKVSELRSNNAPSQIVPEKKQDFDLLLLRLSPELNRTSSNIKNIDLTTKRSPIKNEMNEFKLQQQIKNKEKTGNLEDNLNTAELKVQPNILSSQNTSIVAKAVNSQPRQSKDLYSSNTEILDDKDARTQEIVKQIKQPTEVSKNFENTDTQSPNANQELENTGVKYYDKVVNSQGPDIASAIIPRGTAAVAAMLISEKPLQSKSKQDFSATKEENVVLPSKMHPKEDLMVDAMQTLHGQQKRTKNVLSNDITHTRTSEPDASSAKRIGFKQKRSSTGSNISDELNKKKKRLSPTRNVIIEKQDLHSKGIKKSSKLDEKKSSAILQKKPFTNRHDSDIHDDDSNRTTALKRNTFTIIGSDTSLQKHEDIERAESVTGVPLKISNEADFIPTDVNKNILGKVSKKAENEIGANSTDDKIKKNEHENLKDADSKMNDSAKHSSLEQIYIKERSLKIRTEEPPRNDFIFDSKKSPPQNYKPEFVTNLGPNTYQTETSDSLLLKPIATTLRDKRSNLVEGAKSTLADQNPLESDILDVKNQMTEYAKYRDMPMENPKISNDFKSTAQSNANDKQLEDVNCKNILGVASTLSANETSSKYVKENDPFNHISNIDKRRDPYLKRAKPKSNDTYDRLGADLFQSNKYLQEPDTEDVTMTTLLRDDTIIPSDGENQHLHKPKHDVLTSDSLQKTLPEDVKFAYPTMFDDKTSIIQNRDQPEKKKLQEKKVKTERYPYSSNIDKTPRPTSKIEHDLPYKITDNDKVIYDDTPIDKRDIIDASVQELKNKSILDIISTQKNIPQPVKKTPSVATDKLNDNTDLKYQTNIRQDNLKYRESAVNDVLKIKSDTIQDLYGPIADNNKYVFSDQTSDNAYTYLDTKSNEPQVEVDMFHIANANKEKEEEKEAVFIKDHTMETESIRESISNPITDTSEKLVAIKEKGSFSKMIDDDKLVYDGITNNGIDILDTHFQGMKNKSDNDLISTQKFITKQGSYSHSVMTDKYDEIGLIDQINQKPASDSTQKVKPAIVQVTNEQMSENKFVSSDQIYNKEEFPESNEPDAKIDTPDIVDADMKIKDKTFEFSETARSVSQNNSPFSGYSGVISEVLSNISENIEGEEKYSTRSLGSEKNIRSYKSITQLDTEAYRDQRVFEKEYTNIDNESAFTASTSTSDNIGVIHKLKYGSYDVPRGSLVKSSMSTLKEGDGNIRTGTIPKAFGATEYAADSSYKLKRRDRYPPDILNKDHQDELDSNVNKSNLDETISITLKKKNSPLYLDLSFYSYMNDNNQRVVQTKSPLIEQQQPGDGTVTVVKTLIRPGNELRIQVDNENDLFLNILNKDVKKSNRGSAVGTPIRSPRREKHIVDRAKRHDDILNKNLALIYEYDLIPLHNVIKDLTQEVNTLSAQQEKLQMRLRNTKRTKSLRLIPVVKRCGCRRM